MTLTEISRYFHLNETIQKNREALKFLRERAEPAAPSLNGMPHASGVKDSTGRLAVERAFIRFSVFPVASIYIDSSLFLFMFVHLRFSLFL